eukprot:TRINITY_DN1944_c0_g1_i2.p1 TRINITY_DN1944_c0_g1~~TRINITY_DN1944_c0_g1_i2.p1  ORF type:complete len:151 (-),score=34.99 TRINITY_DN1944_c0_g1_i2:27-479(-)
METALYELHNIRPNSHYEVRISYPATTPTSFDMEFLEPKSESTGTRDILNTEKIMFTTDSSGYIVGREQPKESKYYQVKATAKEAGVATDPSNPPHSSVVFNIVLETLLYGAPYELTKMVPVILGLVVLVFSIILPQVFPRVSGFKKLRD